MTREKSKTAMVCIAATACALMMPLPAVAAGLALPADCTVGTDCFFQQFPDMAPGQDAVDPFCGHATYDGHKGVDLRVLSMADMDRGVAVTAVAAGTVRRVRDGEPDRLIRNDADRVAVKGRECGNGLVIRHDGGLETQYCHLRQGSIEVAPGASVKRGAVLGMIGASGLAQFPHVHLSVRRDGTPIDPVTGRPLSEGCLADMADAEPLFSADIMDHSGIGGTSLLSFGVAGEVIEHDTLVETGAPPTARSDSSAWVVWGWFANLRAGDRIVFELEDGEGEALLTSESEAIERTKAAYSAYSGKRGPLAPGRYAVTVGLVREGQTILSRSRTVTVE